MTRATVCLYFHTPQFPSLLFQPDHQGGDVGGREVMRAHPELVRTIDAPAEEHIDIDTPSDLAAAQNRR